LMAGKEKRCYLMIKFAIDMYKKYEEGVNYLFFGGLAFVVNMVAYALAAWALGADTENVPMVMAATAFAWVVSVLFAYWTNRTFVFKSKTTDRAGVWKEFGAFVSARVATGILEQVIVVGMVTISIDDMIAKFVGNIVVIVTNYIFSKLWIFKKKG